MKIIGVVGPTAVGKSALALELAKEYNGEIISCDSMQIYKGMDIGTAKPTKEEMLSFPHHLIDIKEPDENFSCADYATLAKNCIEDIRQRGKTPIFCGGTGLYLDSVLEIPSFCESAKDENYRKELEEFVKVHGAEELHKMLEEVDEISAKSTHANNIKRVIRALEIYKCTGIPKSEWDRRSKETPPPYESEIFFLNYSDRAALYSKIDLRVDIMIKNGLLDEARALYEKGMLKDNFTSYGAIGYKEFIPFFQGACSLNDCIERIKTSTRQYAKRQLTWFCRNGRYHTIYVDKCDALTYIKDFFANN